MVFIKTQLRFKRVLGAGCCLALLVAAGCAAVGPDYTGPTVAVTESWHTEASNDVARAEADEQELVNWWQTFEDPVLNTLIAKTVESNLDLEAARSRLRQARAQRSVVRSDLFPSLDVSGSATRSGSGDNSGADSARMLYAAGFDAGWELDFFGSIRRSVEASQADLQASREDINDLLVTLSAEVALNYLELRTYQARLAVAEKNLAMQEETYQLECYRLIAGLSDELAVSQARSNMANTRSRLPSLRSQVEAAKNRLAVLLGQPPGRLHETLGEGGPVPDVPPRVAVGMPADLLRRRPDIRRAERELAAQTARIGVARAELYPKLTLNGSIGYESLSTGSLLTPGSRAWSLGPRISWPVFQAGAIRANIKVQSELQQQALLEYESVVLSALEEVEDAMVAYMEEQKRKRALQEAASAAREAVDFAQNKYDAGLTDFDTLLIAQQTLLSYQDELVQSRAEVSMNLVRLYKALGGGWTSKADSTGTADSKATGSGNKISFQGEPCNAVKRIP